VHLAWTALHGEVDFDELLAFATLRYGAPEAFDFLRRHRRTLHAADFAFDDKVKEQRLSAVREQWTVLVSDVRIDWDTKAASTLIGFLAQGFSKYPLSSRLQRLQSVKHTNPTDYWERMLREGLEASEQSDQSVLHLIQAWAENGDSRLIRALAKPIDKFGSIFDHFITYIQPPSKLLSLANDVLQAAMDLGVYEAYSVQPRLFSILDQSQKTIETQAIGKWLRNAAHQVIQHNLWLVVMLLIWAESKHGLQAEAMQAISRDFHENALKIFNNEPALLPRVLDRRTPDTLGKLMGTIGGTGDLSRWRGLGSALQRAANDAPHSIAAQLAFIVYEPKDFSFSPTQATQLFGEDQIPEVARLLALHIEIVSTDEVHERHFLEQMKESAQNWLNSHPSLYMHKTDTPPPDNASGATSTPPVG
jgi:hypothetical protein